MVYTRVVRLAVTGQDNREDGNLGKTMEESSGVEPQG